MIEIETTCRLCGRRFMPSPEAFRTGRWRHCPACMGCESFEDGRPRDGPPGVPRQPAGESATPAKEDIP